jgi:hypothetical protein
MNQRAFLWEINPDLGITGRGARCDTSLENEAGFT